MGKPQDKKNARPKSADQGQGDVFSSTLATVIEGMSAAKEDADPSAAILTLIQDVLRTAVRGHGDLVTTAKALAVGVLRGLGKSEEAALQVLARTAEAVLREGLVLRADPGACTKGLVLGAIASAKDHAVDRTAAATATARGALEGAGTEGDQVRDALKEPIGGVTVTPA